MRWTVVLAWLACSSPNQAPEPIATPVARDAAIADARLPTDAAPDAAIPATLDAALAELRTRGFAAAADTIAKRAAQPKPKMRLSANEAHATALAVLDVTERASFRALHGVMPRSTVELARAVRERGVSLADADAIAAYLVRFVATLAFERLAVFDENHSHVTGREWHEIDYTGEGMTWQSQRDFWKPRGVDSFERVEFIHAYFVGAARLPHWQKVYRPRGRVDDVPAP